MNNFGYARHRREKPPFNGKLEESLRRGVVLVIG